LLINSFETASNTETWGKYKSYFLLLNSQVEIDFGANEVCKIALYAG
jgi:hypothetical protein